MSHNRVKTAYVVAGVTNTLEMQRGARHVEPANVTRHGPLHENMAPSTNPEVNSDSVTVFKSRLSLVKPITRLKTFLFSVAFSLPFISNTAPVPGPASLELRPYGAIQICLLLFIVLIFLTLGRSSRGRLKITNS